MKLFVAGCEGWGKEKRMIIKKIGNYNSKKSWNIFVSDSSRERRKRDGKRVKRKETLFKWDTAGNNDRKRWCLGKFTWEKINVILTSPFYIYHWMTNVGVTIQKRETL